MNIGEKVSLYKERLGHRNFKEFGNAAGISGDWILEISKRSELKMVDINNLVKLSKYLSIPIEQLVKDDDNKIAQSKQIEITNINPEADDIGIIIEELILLLDKDDTKFNGKLLNKETRQICKDALDVVFQLINQHQ